MPTICAAGAKRRSGPSEAASRRFSFPLCGGEALPIRNRRQALALGAKPIMTKEPFGIGTQKSSRSHVNEKAALKALPRAMLRLPSYFEIYEPCFMASNLKFGGVPCEGLIVPGEGMLYQILSSHRNLQILIHAKVCVRV